MLNEQISIHGITDIGEWTALDDVAGDPTKEYNATNVYTRTSWGLTTEEGARIVPSMSTVMQRSGQSPSVIDSFVSEFGVQLQIGMLDAQLQTLRRLLGLPLTAHTGDLGAGTPTAETLVVKGSELGTVEHSLYVETMGPRGPRRYYFPRCRVAQLAEQAASRTAYFEPQATFDCYENNAGQTYWIIDAIA